MAERRPLVLIDGCKKLLPVGDTVPGVGDDFVCPILPTGEMLTIPQDKQLIVCGSYCIEDGATLCIEGLLAIV